MSKAKTKKISKYHNFWERNRQVDGYLLKKTIGEWCVSLGRVILLFGMCFLILQPILNKISVSFMMEEDLYNPMVIAIPEHFTVSNYVLAIDFMSYWNSLKNTALISLTIAILQIIVCTLVGYGFARFDFPLKKVWFAMVILTIIVPPQTISSSLHLHFAYFDVFGIIKAITGDTINLRQGVTPYYLMSATCMGLKNGLYIFLIRQFFRNIPKELEEAAYVDGCGTLKTFFRIMLPDAKPIITSCFLFAFVWQWTDGFYSRLFLGNVSLLSLQVSRIGDRLGGYISTVLGNGVGGITVTPSAAYINCIVSTGTLMVIVPLIALYLFAQKGFVESLSTTGIKM